MTHKDHHSQHTPIKRITARDIAVQLGISEMTVSRALNNRGYVDKKTRERVLATSKELGYSPNQIAKSLVSKKTHTIGVVVPKMTHSFFPEIIRGIEEVAFLSKYQLILTHSAEKAGREADAIRMLESKRVDGILLSMAQSVEDYSLYRKMVRLSVPFVFFDRCVFNIGASCVSVDDEESAKGITMHLIDHGYERIAHLRGQMRVSVGRNRLTGFKKALAERNIPLHKELIIESGFDEMGGYESMNTLLSLPKRLHPRAVVAVNDAAAFGAMLAIEEHGLRIPQDIAIVGFSDDIRAALVNPPLTTMRQPAYELGKRAALKLLDIIEGRSDSIDEIIIKNEQVIRRSCGCPKKKQKWATENHNALLPQHP
jgi:DNA-binding LacI/PurR family transcriptional regulator